MFEAYMGPRGPMNLFSYFPQGSILPDLGNIIFRIPFRLANNWLLI
jgi:hypothetical protein